MIRHFVVWCLEEEVEQVIDAAAKHGEIVGPVRVDRHITGQYTGSAEIRVCAAAALTTSNVRDVAVLPVAVAVTEVLDDVADFYRKLWASGSAGTAVTLRMERDNDAFEVTVRSGDRSKYHKYGSD